MPYSAISSGVSTVAWRCYCGARWPVKYDHAPSGDRDYWPWRSTGEAWLFSFVPVVVDVGFHAGYVSLQPYSAAAATPLEELQDTYAWVYVCVHGDKCMHGKKGGIKKNRERMYQNKVDRERKRKRRWKERMRKRKKKRGKKEEKEWEREIENRRDPTVRSERERTTWWASGPALCSRRQASRRFPARTCELRAIWG